VDSDPATNGRELLYLSRADVMGCSISPAEANAGIESGFVAKAAARAHTRGAQMPLAEAPATAACHALLTATA
jgi:hypothetical protein